MNSSSLNNNSNLALVWRAGFGLLFSLFTFCYVYFLQGEVLAQAQYVHSHGITHYSMFVGALIITLSLQLLQWVVGMLSMLPSRFHTLSYLPSATALIALIDMAESPVNIALARWAWLAPTCIAGYIVLCIIINNINRFIPKDDDDYYSATPSTCANCIILLATMLAIGSVPSSKDVRYYELKTERLILEGDYHAASLVGSKALPSTQRLTQLRMFALSLEDSLAQRLFSYPQLFASEGLLCVADTDSIHRINARHICAHLGAYSGKSIRTSMRYLQLMLQDSTYNHSRQLADYYLCSLLLDKRIDDFANALPNLYNLSDTVLNACDSLPRAYKEALLLISEEQYAIDGKIVVKGDSLGTLSDTTYSARYRDYIAMKAGITNQRERTNKTRREHGDTFWWYYDN